MQSRPLGYGAVVIRPEPTLSQVSLGNDTKFGDLNHFIESHFKRLILIIMLVFHLVFAVLTKVN